MNNSFIKYKYIYNYFFNQIKFEGIIMIAKYAKWFPFKGSNKHTTDFELMKHRQEDKWNEPLNPQGDLRMYWVFECYFLTMFC